MSGKTEGSNTAAVVPAGQARASWPFGGDQVTKATTALPERQRDLVRWLFYDSIQDGLSMKDAASAIGYDVSVVWKVLTGKYAGSLESVADAIESYKRIRDARIGLVENTFVETDTAARIWKICDAAITYRTIAMIFSSSQIGKTFALEEYAHRHNHGATRYVRLPSAAGVQMVLKTFAKSCGLSHKCAYEEMRERILHAIDGNTLVIVDELHLAFNTYQKHARVAVLEVIREIHDRTHCGMVLSGTNVARDEIERGQHKLLLEQLRRRGIFRLQLPDAAPMCDRVAIAESFGLPEMTLEAKKVVDEIVCSSGLKAYTCYLQAGSKLAAKKKQPFAWRHVLDAYDAIKAYSKYPTEVQ